MLRSTALINTSIPSITRSEKVYISNVFVLEKFRSDFAIFQKRFAYLLEHPSDDYSMSKALGDACRDLAVLMKDNETYNFDLAKEFAILLHEFLEMREKFLSIKVNYVLNSQMSDSYKIDVIGGISLTRARNRIYKINLSPVNIKELKDSLQELKSAYSQWEKYLTQPKKLFDECSVLKALKEVADSTDLFQQFTFLKDLAVYYHKEFGSEYLEYQARLHLNFANFMLDPKNKNEYKYNAEVKQQVSDSLKFANQFYSRSSTIPAFLYRFRLVKGLMEIYKIGVTSPTNQFKSAFYTKHDCTTLQAKSPSFIKSIHAVAEVDQYNFYREELKEMPSTSIKTTLVVNLNDIFCSAKQIPQIEKQLKDEIIHFYKHLDLNTVNVVVVTDDAYRVEAEAKVESSTVSAIKSIEHGVGKPVFSAVYYMSEGQHKLAVKREEFLQHFDKGLLNKNTILVDMPSHCNAAKKEGFLTFQADGTHYAKLTTHFNLPEFKMAANNVANATTPAMIPKP